MRILNLLASGNLAGIERLNIDIYSNSMHEHLYCFMFHGGEAAKILKEKGAYTNVLKLKVKHSLLQQYKAIKKIVVTEKVDILVVHHETPIAWVVASLLSKELQIPFYIYAHCEYHDIVGAANINKLKYMYKKYTFRYSLKRCTKVIAISNFVKNSIINANNFIADKITVIYNGVNTQVFDINEKSDNDDFTLIYVGRLVPQKGVNLLIDAIKQISFPVICIIVGDGNQREELENQVKKNHLSKIVRFVGVQNNTADWYKKGDVFVHPAIWEEGFGITIIEAMASGLPCISFKKGALPEIIKDNENGLITEECSAEALAEKIREIYRIAQKDEIAFMKKNARKTARMFDIKRTVEMLDNLFQAK